MKITLGITDVPEGQESALASGPTLPDPTTVSDACGVVRRYDLLSKLPPSIRTQFEHPETIPETPKAGDPAFEPRRAAFQILLGRHDLFHPAHRASESAGVRHHLRQHHRQLACRKRRRIFYWRSLRH